MGTRYPPYRERALEFTINHEVLMHNNSPGVLIDLVARYIRDEAVYVDPDGLTVLMARAVVLLTSTGSWYRSTGEVDENEAAEVAHEIRRALRPDEYT